jgi:L-iditol 2-dehydrogenase
MDYVALGEPISCAMYSGMHSGVQLGDVVVVMGGGFAGQIIAQCAKRKGAYKVVVADVLDGKLALAQKLGADIAVNLKKVDLAKVVSDLTKGQGADVVVEAAGSADSFNTASEIIRHNGKFVFYSWVTQPITLNISRWHDDGLEFINTCLVHHSWRERYVWTPATFRPVIQGQIQIRPLITHEFKLEDIKAGFELADKDDSAIKIIFRI